MATPIDENYVNAKAVLLDALEALGPLRQAIILVGAQAVYVHTQERDADFAVSPFTYNADLALDPELPGSEPKITEAMLSAGLSLTGQPGIYRKTDGSQVDLLVPEAVGGPSRRGARLGNHGNRAAMKVHGLEGALVSRKSITIGSLSGNDTRSYAVEIAGPAALLVAKVHKIAERAESNYARRMYDKDAFDVYRILRAVDAAELAAEARNLLERRISSQVAADALSWNLPRETSRPS